MRGGRVRRRRGRAAASPTLGRVRRGAAGGSWMTSTMTAAVGLAWSEGKAAAHGVGGDRPVGHLARCAREWAKAVEVLGGDGGKSAPRRGRSNEREREGNRESERRLSLGSHACNARARGGDDGLGGEMGRGRRIGPSKNIGSGVVQNY
uniref:Uncharacterized protein n=1 Tax=Oryza sativa subsp. japonica TaxID=39947 RepID=Q6YX23_ORYSJ|nr:hypothetical protein [Oryza sativa Japonica Group]